jgi:hypothetical protein
VGQGSIELNRSADVLLMPIRQMWLGREWSQEVTAGESLESDLMYIGARGASSVDDTSMGDRQFSGAIVGNGGGDCDS